MTVIDKSGLFFNKSCENRATAKVRAEMRATCEAAFARVMAAKPAWEAAAAQRATSGSAAIPDSE